MQDFVHQQNGNNRLQRLSWNPTSHKKLRESTSLWAEASANQAVTIWARCTLVLQGSELRV